MIEYTTVQGKIIVQDGNFPRNMREHGWGQSGTKLQIKSSCVLVRESKPQTRNKWVKIFLSEEENKILDIENYQKMFIWEYLRGVCECQKCFCG
ncbi:hypothetical protein Lal_00034399 [Lupinus albus]|nr:hypothetical protein Lal_00034399 [Lupinus albus]